MAGAISTGSKPRLLQAGITELFGMDYKAWKPVHEIVFPKKSSDQNFETAVQMLGMGMASLKGEGAALALDSYQQGFVRITTHNVWGKRARVTMEAFDDDLYMKQASVLSKELSKALFQAKETNGAAFINNATSTSAPYVGGDGKALLATDHPTKIGTQSNKPSTDSDLTELALEDAVINIRNFVGDDGLRIVVEPVTLLIPNQLIFDAQRILKSQGQSATANNDLNALKALGLLQKIQSWSFLADPDQWTIITDIDGACLYQRKAPELMMHRDDSTYDYIYSMMERYSFDYYNFRRFYGSVGA